MKKIVRGNDFTLRIPVMKIVNGERVAFPLPGCTDIKVNVVNQYRRVALGYTIDVSADNVLLARVEGDRVAVGTYALEVKGKLFGNDWRSNEYEQFQLVDNNAAGDTVFGNHQQLVAQVPGLMEATAKAVKSASVHPMIVSARFHGYFEYLHPFRDGNGRTGRLLSNFILLSNGLPELIIRKEWREEYVAALRAKRTEGTDEHLIAFFFRSAIDQMEEALEQKRKASRPILFF